MDYIWSHIVSQVKKTGRQDRSLFYGQYYESQWCCPLVCGLLFLCPSSLASWQEWPYLLEREELGRMHNNSFLIRWEQKYSSLHHKLWSTPCFFMLLLMVLLFIFPDSKQAMDTMASLETEIISEKYGHFFSLHFYTFDYTTFETSEIIQCCQSQQKQFFSCLYSLQTTIALPMAFTGVIACAGGVI